MWDDESMATRKLTFSIPEDIARPFLRRVPARDRSRYVSEAIAARLRERDDRLIRSCEAANSDPDVLSIEREWDVLNDPIAEPWSGGEAR